MAKRTRQPQYFLGGANWDGEDQYSDFIESGRWETGSDEYTKNCLPRLEKMRKGDRIAIKKMLGQGSSQIQIRAIGIIKFIDIDRGIVYVDWIRKGMKRNVDSSNAFAVLHGPYLNTGKHADWINQIFCLGCNKIFKALIGALFICYKNVNMKKIITFYIIGIIVGFILGNNFDIVGLFQNKKIQICNESQFDIDTLHLNQKISYMGIKQGECSEYKTVKNITSKIFMNIYVKEKNKILGFETKPTDDIGESKLQDKTTITIKELTQADKVIYEYIDAVKFSIK